MSGSARVGSTLRVCLVLRSSLSTLSPYTMSGSFGSGAILLRAIDAVREAVVGADVVHLRGRLVVPAGPGLAAVGGDDGALVDAHDLAVRIVRVDPQFVVIV